MTLYRIKDVTTGAYYGGYDNPTKCFNTISGAKSYLGSMLKDRQRYPWLYKDAEFQIEEHALTLVKVIK
jgi:hypothetical protein